MLGDAGAATPARTLGKKKAKKPLIQSATVFLTCRVHGSYKGRSLVRRSAPSPPPKSHKCYEIVEGIAWGWRAIKA